MSRTLIRFSVPLIGSAAVVLGLMACSSDTKTNPPAAGTGGSAGGGVGGASGAAAGGATGSGGGAATGGKGASGGAAAGGAAAVDAGDVYACQAKPPLDPGGAGVKDDACCDTGTDGGLGKVGHCVDPASITDQVQRASFGHDSCGPTLKCAPTAAAMADAGATGTYAKCSAAALGGLEGRCLPKCFVAGNPQAPQLKQDDCSQPQLVCAPCFNPLDGSATGACTQKAGDAPTTTAPTPYKTCGAFDGGPPGGTCVPKDLALNSGNPAAGSLKQDDCPTNQLCVPTLKANNVNGCFDQCTTTLASFGAQYGAGACVPTYVVKDVNPTGLAILTKGTCSKDGELCAPCLDPLNNGVPTHSCE